MCGLFGAISPKWNPNVVRTLAVANRERGTDALGFFDSTGRMVKGATDPMKVLAQENVSTWLENSSSGCKKHDATWFVAGHTRLGTRGSNCRKNAHPFRYGKIIGSHNGMVTAPQEYKVDSMYLIDSLSKANGDYNKAWADISGYWGMTWFDGEAFYLQTHNNTISMAEVDGVWYYSSDDEHLKAAIGHNVDVYTMASGETWKFTMVDGAVVSKKTENFVSTATTYVKHYNNVCGYRKYSAGYAGGGAYELDYDTTGEENFLPKGGIGTASTTNDTGQQCVDDDVKDWDSDWRDAWSDYCTASEHEVGA